MDYKISVILPIYNNGLFLYGKGFSSLLRCSMFNDMEILLIDDGSTDGITEHYIRKLKETYANVRTYFFADGGSGSASRPRNKGVELATADYIAFLDPDDELINDGYAKLYNAAMEAKCDLTVGNMTMFSNKILNFRYYYYFKNEYGSDIVNGDKKHFLETINFTPMNIQGMIIKKTLIVSNGLKQVEGAIGEDSLFCWQLMLCSKNIKCIDISVMIYYASRVGSEVNSANKKMFEKHLILEPERKKWLKENEMLESYMETRFNAYFSGWILKKFALVKNEEMIEAAKPILANFKYYEEYYDGKNHEINKFLKEYQ